MLTQLGEKYTYKVSVSPEIDTLKMWIDRLNKANDHNWKERPKANEPPEHDLTGIIRGLELMLDVSVGKRGLGNG